jgi:ATP-dependent Zn protease
MQNKEELLDTICFILGGRAAEETFFGKVIVIFRFQLEHMMTYRKHIALLIIM